MAGIYSDFNSEHNWEEERAELMAEMRRDECPDTDGDIDDAAAFEEMMDADLAADQMLERQEMEDFEQADEYFGGGCDYGE